MSIDLDTIRTTMPAAVPFISTLGLEYLELSESHAVLGMPDQDRLHNHVGGPHAGAMFSLGESASGAVVLAAFSDLLAEVTPLAASAEIRFLTLAKGDVQARATLGRSVPDVKAELATGGLPHFPVQVQITDAQGAVTGEMTVNWALKPHRRPA
ncbi:MAG TPA: DUF4442 domain-containing protein [Mycobacteriales bacterium]|nr:DUF4442 domain-containing protein [Mycobacteriales bacterium]